MKILYGMPEWKVKAALKRLVRLYGNQWGFIEENNYSVLFDCTVEDKKEEDKKSELMVVEVLSDDETEDLEPLLKGDSRNHKEQIRSSICTQQDEAAEEVVRTELSLRKRARTSYCETTRDTEDKKPVIAETSGRRKLGIDNNGTKNVLDIYLNFSDETLQEELSLAVIQPVAGVPDSTQLELVSSNNREMKVSLTFNPFNKYYSKIPSLDAVLKVVEDKFHKRYGIIDPHISVKKLMRELCECILAMNTDSSDQLHLPPMIDTSKKSNAEVHTDSKDHHKINSNNHPNHSNLSIDSLEIQIGAKNPIFVEDITRGEERQPISLVNDNGVIQLPKFFYISKNIVYNTANVKFSIARTSDHNYCSNCSGNCLSAPEKCACTGETRGEFAYTPAGLVEEKFLSECIAISRRKVSKEHLFYCENCPLENSLGKK